MRTGNFFRKKLDWYRHTLISEDDDGGHSSDGDRGGNDGEQLSY